ncbi:MAG TPA: AMP-binding protein [Acidimicrobiales bacterium]|nr:AMP-binding protein [Acidimicrobiales bacterium]
MNLAEIIEGHPEEAPALLGSETYTYGRLRREVAAARGGLTALGVAPGDRVALGLANDWPFVVTYLAVLGVGAVAVPVDPSLPSTALHSELVMVRPAAVVVGPPGGAHVGGALAELRDDAGRPPRRVAAPGAEDCPDATPLADLLGAAPVPLAERRPDDPAVLVFTAGTAGSPKAAILTHGSITANMDQVQHHPGRALVPGDLSYGVLPLFHVFGLNVVLGLSLRAGAGVLLADRFDPVRALADIPRHRVTVLAGAPPLFAALAKAEPAAGGTGSELASIRLAVSGASALPAEVAEAFESRFGLPLWQGYGLTEASPVVTSSVIGGVPKPGSIGVPVPGVELRLVDEAGQDALVGDAGELWARGPNIFPGYWEDPDATAAALTDDGWLRTGDVAVVDDDGYVYLVDRVKDLIIVSGFNVYPAEVEQVLAEHPGVAEAAAVGLPDERTGEAIHAFVVARDAGGPHPGAPDPGLSAELDKWCRARLAAYKCPAEIRVVEGLPHGMAGKLLRRALREGTVEVPG